MTMHQHMFTAVFEKSGDWWAAWIEELPGANTQGRTIEEARANLREAALMILEDDDPIEGERVVEVGNLYREPFVLAH